MNNLDKAKAELSLEAQLEKALKKVARLVRALNHSDVPCIGSHRMDAAANAMHMVHSKVEEIDAYLKEYSIEADHY